MADERRDLPFIGARVFVSLCDRGQIADATHKEVRDQDSRDVIKIIQS